MLLMFFKKRNLCGRDFFLAFRQLEFMSHSQKNLQRLKIGRRRKENTSTFFRHSSHKINTTSFSLSLSLSPTFLAFLTFSLHHFFLSLFSTLTLTTNTTQCQRRIFMKKLQWEVFWVVVTFSQHYYFLTKPSSVLRQTILG